MSRGATEAEIKSAYRKLAVRHHPDKNPGDQEAEEKFKEAAEAYSVLSDAEQRARYDRFGHAGVSGASAGAGWGAQGFGGIEDILGDLFGFGDMFGGRAAGGARRSAAQRGADLRYDLEMTLEEAAAGMTAQLRIPRLEACDTCRRYVKGVDRTRLGLAVPLVDEVAGAALDVWAREHGYEKIELNLVGL